MACVISISSDEEDFIRQERPTKKIKLDPSVKEKKIGRNNNIIVLDDDEDKADKSKRSCQTDPTGANREIKGSSKSPNLKNANSQSHSKTHIEDTSSEPTKTIHNEIQEISETEPKLTESNMGTSKCDAENRLDMTEPVAENNQVELLSDFVSDKLNETESNNEDNPCDLFKGCKKVQELINSCLSQIETEKVRNLLMLKIPHCKKAFDNAGEAYTKSDTFIKELEEKISLSRNNQVTAIQCFSDIYYLLKKHKTKDTENMQEKNHDVVIRKLEKALGKIRKRINMIEQEEVNFDDEQDSSFFQLARYRDRAVKVYEKLCKYRNEDPNCGRVTHNRLDFSASSIPEVNKAINKKFKSNSVFPTYYAMECCLKKCVSKNDIQMSESDLKKEARFCFEKLGNLIQHRRKLDLLGAHSHYLSSNQDPAAADSELNEKLVENYRTAKNKINDICDKYTRIQESGIEPQLSSDSDDSDLPKSEDEADD